MRVKRAILSTILLMIFIIGGGVMLSQYSQRCCEPLHIEHHNCCHCENHADDCDTHRLAIEHKCANDKILQLEFTLPSGEHSRLTRGGIHAKNIELYSAILLIAALCFVPLLTAAMRRVKRCDNEDIRALFSPSSRSLRAPPVLA